MEMVLRTARERMNWTRGDEVLKTFNNDGR